MFTVWYQYETKRPGTFECYPVATYLTPQSAWAVAAACNIHRTKRNGRFRVEVYRVGDQGTHRAPIRKPVQTIQPL